MATEEERWTRSSCCRGIEQEREGGASGERGREGLDWKIPFTDGTYESVFTYVGSYILEITYPEKKRTQLES